MVSGPTTVIEAIVAGHRAADSIDRYLSGRDLKEGRIAKPAVITGEDVVAHELMRRERPEMPTLPVRARLRNFKEVELGGFIF